MSTEELKLSDSKDNGYLEDPNWWHNINFDHSYTFFNPKNLYPDYYYNNDHGVINTMVQERYDFIIKHFGPSCKSLADFGSAGGWYTKIFKDKGLDVLVLDGSEFAGIECAKKDVPFQKQDFRIPFDLHRKYDVVMCMDLAEHIEPPFAGTLIYNVTRHTDFVFFAAETNAILNKPHLHHCNEVPYKYWINLFRYFDFELYNHGGRADWFIFKKKSTEIINNKSIIFNGTQLEILPENIAIIRGDSGPCSWVYQTRRLDYDQGMLSRIIPHIAPNKAVVDIGAFIGSHSFAYQKHSSCVISFEPNPSAFSCLSYNCPKAVKINVAIGDKFTERYWTRIYPNCGASYLADEPSPDCLTVQVRPLDSFTLPKIGYIKIDAEGEEVKILRGGRETIKKNKPTMCIEVNDAALKRTGTSRQELLELLHEYKYHTEPIYPGSDARDQWDVLAIHNDV